MLLLLLLLMLLRLIAAFLPERLLRLRAWLACERRDARRGPCTAAVDTGTGLFTTARRCRAGLVGHAGGCGRYGKAFGGTWEQQTKPGFGGGLVRVSSRRLGSSHNGQSGGRID